MQNLKQYFFLFILIPFLLTHCGGTSEPGTTEEDPSESDVVNTEKLVGTPFEGLETGDDLSWDQFRQDDYLTTTVDSVPIPIFVAYFTLAEEATIREGIEIANEGTGFEAFEVIDVWQDGARVITKVDYIWDPDSGYGEEVFSSVIGNTITTTSHFEGKITAGTVVTDWQMELRKTWIDRWLVAHELGHAFGILNHAMIDYDNDRLLSDEPNNGLEDNSLMEIGRNPISDPLLNDYDYMMRMQGELLLRHLGEEGD